MNSQTLLIRFFTHIFRNCANCFKILLFFSIIISLNTKDILGQNSVWHYVTTVYGGNKAYLNDEMKSLANANKSVWEKMAMPDGSFAIALAEWDCRNKRRLTKQITFYKPDQTVIGTTKKQFEWSEIIPGSTTDFMFTRICLAQPSPKWAKITTLKANLRSFPEISAPVLRVADKGDKFQIVPETGKGGWYNVIDVKTQEDYWLHGNTFEIVETITTK